MEGHKYFIEGIPKLLWREFRQACLYFDTTAKDHLIACMQALIIRYHRKMHDSKAGPIWQQKRKDKKWH